MAGIRIRDSGIVHHCPQNGRDCMRQSVPESAAGHGRQWHPVQWGADGNLCTGSWHASPVHIFPGCTENRPVPRAMLYVSEGYPVQSQWCLRDSKIIRGQRLQHSSGTVMEMHRLGSAGRNGMDIKPPQLCSKQHGWGIPCRDAIALCPRRDGSTAQDDSSRAGSLDRHTNAMISRDQGPIRPWPDAPAHRPVLFAYHRAGCA